MSGSSGPTRVCSLLISPSHARRAPSCKFAAGGRSCCRLATHAFSWWVFTLTRSQSLCNMVRDQAQHSRTTHESDSWQDKPVCIGRVLPDSINRSGRVSAPVLAGHTDESVRKFSPGPHQERNHDDVSQLRSKSSTAYYADLWPRRKCQSPSFIVPASQNPPRHFENCSNWTAPVYVFE
jgi:hypothetical protein